MKTKIVFIILKNSRTKRGVVRGNQRTILKTALEIFNTNLIVVFYCLFQVKRQKVISLC